MKTKSHVRFFSRASHLDADIELADVFKILSNSDRLCSPNNQYIFDGINPTQHPILSKRTDRTNVLNHLKATLCEAFIKNIYEDLTSYLNEILFQAALNGLEPNRLIGQHKVSFEANEILQSGNWASVVELVTNSVFRQLENKRSTKDLIQQINIKLNLGVSQTIINDALPYLEIRHLLVHNEGKADNKFCTTYPQFSFQENQKILMRYTLLTEVRNKIYALVNEFDSKVVDNQIVSRDYLQP